MKGKVTPELLAVCLAEIRAGRTTLLDCVAAHPVVGEELHALLTVAQAIPDLPAVAPDPAFRRRGRVKLVAAINAEKDAVTNTPLQRFWMVRIGNWPQPMKSFIGRMGMPALIVAIIIAVTAATGGSAVYASQGALPGEALYPVKTALEQLQLRLTVGDEGKAQAYIALAEKRISEVEKAVQQQNSAASNAAAEAFAKDLAEADQHLAQAAGSGKDIANLAARLSANLARHEQAFAAVEGRVPDQAIEALARAAAAVEKGLANASARVQKESTPKSTETGVPTRQPDRSAADRPVATPTVVPAVALTSGVTNTVSSTVMLTLTQAISDVQQLATDRSVSGQSYEGLLAKLHAAQEAIARGQPEVAGRVLDAFLNELNAFQNAGHISAENYNTLHASYVNLVSGLGGSPKPQPTRTTGKPESVTTPAAGRPEAAPSPRGRR